MRTIEKQVMELVKRKARGIGLSQRKVAAELGVSLPTVKRWWAGKGVDLTVLHKLCARLGLSLSELLLEAEGGAPSYTYTPEQERILAANPKALALFDLLVSGESVPAIQRKYSLSESSASALLLKLDRLGLIELHPKNKVKLCRSGEPQWIPGGPLSTAYRAKMIEALLGQHLKPDTAFFIHSYLPDDVILLKGKWKELESLMLTCNARGIRRPEETGSYGVYFCFKEFEWNLRATLRSS